MKLAPEQVVLLPDMLVRRPDTPVYDAQVTSMSRTASKAVSLPQMRMLSQAQKMVSGAVILSLNICWHASSHSDNIRLHLIFVVLTLTDTNRQTTIPKTSHMAGGMWDTYPNMYCTLVALQKYAAHELIRCLCKPGYILLEISLTAGLQWRNWMLYY